MMATGWGWVAAWYGVLLLTVAAAAGWRRAEAVRLCKVAAALAWCVALGMFSAVCVGVMFIWVGWCVAAVRVVLHA
jgi:hypothetical protein